MREIYSTIPAEVLTFIVGRKTDVILRKNITAVEQQDSFNEEPNIVYECDEVQFRYNGHLTKEEIESNFDYWWNYPTQQSKTLDERVKELESSKADKQDVDDIWNTLIAAYEEGVQSI